MKIIKNTITLDELNQMAAGMFGDLVKAVVDIERELVAVDAELHADLEAILLEDGSRQKNLWGINIYPELEDDGFIEFDSMINMRPSQSNKSRSIEDENIRNKIRDVVFKRVKK